MRESKLTMGGQNLFQAIKAKRAEAEAKGIEIINMAIGQPQGPAFKSACEGASQAVLSLKESMHEYQDNGSPGVPGFAEDFVRLYKGVILPEKSDDIAFLPIPGIKPMEGLVTLACGSADTYLNVATTTNPGYPTPKTWCDYLDTDNTEVAINPENGFLFNPYEEDEKGDSINLFHINYPHNPSGAGATKEWWERLCDYCQVYDIRLFNDAAYAMLVHDERVSPLCSVAHKFPDLSWAEAFSASKVIGNGTGWRIGAMVGSPDFIGDIATIKGNADSGFFAPAAFGVLECLKKDMKSVVEISNLYKKRIEILTDLLTLSGMKLAVKPGAGFFTLWQTPDWAFGQKIESSKQFNFLMIEKTGIMGVHFGPYTRYAVVGQPESDAVLGKISTGFKKAKVSYDD